MFGERCVVDNRVFLLGLDKLYRDAIKEHERGELLGSARVVAEKLSTRPANVPVEGYYAEDALLTEYFRLVRALQEVDQAATPTVESLPEFQRLRDVVSSPLYGPAEDTGKLLPTGRDALSRALLDTFPDWTVATLTAAAHKEALETDEFSLVGLAARVQDSVVLAAARESVVLYALMPIAAARYSLPPRYIWKVDRELSRCARRFVDTFNRLFGEELPPPKRSQATVYWHAGQCNEIVGRCVRLGLDDSVTPIRHYHWGICRTTRQELVVHEFWDPEVWTTTRYRSSLPPAGICPKSLGKQNDNGRTGVGKVARLWAQLWGARSE